MDLELLTFFAILGFSHPRRSKCFLNFSSSTRAYAFGIAVAFVLFLDAWGWTRDSTGLFSLNKRRSLHFEMSFLISFALVAPSSFDARMVDRATTTEQASEAPLVLIAFFLVDVTWLAFTVVWALGKSFGSTRSLWSALQDKTISLDTAVVTNAKTFVV